jgi:uncharacterized membrane protein
MTDNAQADVAHIDDTIETLRRLEEEHRLRFSHLQRLVKFLTAQLSRPIALVFVIVSVVVWIGINITLISLGRTPIDEPPFGWLGLVATLVSLYVALIILASQRADDELANRREFLALEVAILGEQKTAKVIQLLEELRRDLPQVSDRDDERATKMAAPSDPEILLDAIQEAVYENKMVQDTEEIEDHY